MTVRIHLSKRNGRVPHRGSGEPGGLGVKGIDVKDEAAEFGRWFQ